jgi:hypothetical protein
MRVFSANVGKVVPYLSLINGDPHYVPIGQIKRGHTKHRLRIGPQGAGLIRPPDEDHEYSYIIAAGLEKNPHSRNQEGYRITVPQPGDERDALVRWQFSSGSGGHAKILVEENRETFIMFGSFFQESNQHAEVILVLHPGENLCAWRDGAGIPPNKVRAILSYDGQDVRITLGSSGLWSGK